MMVPTRTAPSVTDLYSLDIAFCAASAMSTTTSRSEMPSAPASRRSTLSTKKSSR